MCLTFEILSSLTDRRKCIITIQQERLHKSTKSQCGTILCCAHRVQILVGLKSCLAATQGLHSPFTRPTKPPIQTNIKLQITIIIIVHSNRTYRIQKKMEINFAPWRAVKVYNPPLPPGISCNNRLSGPNRFATLARALLDCANDVEITCAAHKLPSLEAQNGFCGRKVPLNLGGECEAVLEIVKHTSIFGNI